MSKITSVNPPIRRGPVATLRRTYDLSPSLSTLAVLDSMSDHPRGDLYTYTGIKIYTRTNTKRIPSVSQIAFLTRIQNIIMTGRFERCLLDARLTLLENIDGGGGE